MNVWTAFFLVVSIVILAAPLLLTREVPDRNGADSIDISDTGFIPEDVELQLDLATGRLAREDYEIICGQKVKTTKLDSGVRGGHGNIPEG